MNYKETLQFIYQQLPMYQRQGKAAYKSDLKTTLALDTYFRHPHQHYKTVHVAGTNGKGSVSHMLASILQEAGYKVGLYTSPHLRDFRERIRINGEMVPEKYIIEFVEKHKDLIQQEEPSFFEITVAMAFDYFALERIDVAIVETGMGGRLDSTNIITPVTCAITNIGLDHTAFLGNTLAKIAGEKAGIMKEGVPVVLGEKHPETYKVFAKKSQEIAAPMMVAQDRFKITKSSAQPSLKTQEIEIFDHFTQNNTTYKLDLTGEYQQKNLITVLAILETSRNKFTTHPKHIENGLENVRKNTGFLGRWHILSDQPLTIADTGHNKEGMEQVLRQLEAIECNTLHIVIGVVDDKNIEPILTLLPKDARYYFTRASIPRALDEKKLMQAATNNGLVGRAYPSVENAYNSARENAGKNDIIFIGGSTFVVAEVV